jgi:hypothetical protein
MLLPILDAAYSATATRFSARSGLARSRLVALTAFLHLVQPMARLLGRIGYGLAPWRRRAPAGFASPWPTRLAVWCDSWHPPELRLTAIEENVRRSGLAARPGGNFDDWDIEVRTGMFGAARMVFVAEDHGAGNQYLRFRIWPRFSRLALVGALCLVTLAMLAAADEDPKVAAVLSLAGACVIAGLVAECSVAVAVLRGAASQAGAGASATAVDTELLGRAHDAAGSGSVPPSDTIGG